MKGMLSNRRLSKSVWDCSLYELVRQIKYGMQENAQARLDTCMDFREFLLLTEMKFEAEGVLTYTPKTKEEAEAIVGVHPGIRAIVRIDQGISDTYRSLIPKAHYVQPQMYPAHITVVRNLKETPVNLEAWGKYEGERVPFTYQNEVEQDGPYYFLRCESPRIAEIRRELGLPDHRDRFKGYHITIGNAKS